MTFNWDMVYHIFEQYKNILEFKDYFDEMDKNRCILTEVPFNVEKAKWQVSKLSEKYGQDLNWLAAGYSNGRVVTNQQITKTPQQIWDDLRYINDHIPIIALKRELTSYAFTKLLGIE